MATKTNTEINGNKYYRIRRTVGYTYKDGEKHPVVKNFYGSSKGDAEAMYNKYLQEEAKKKYELKQSFDMATFHSRAEEFIVNSLRVSAKYAENTKEKYEMAYRCHVENTWIDKELVKDISAKVMQRFYNELDVTASVLETIQRFMSAFYKWMTLNEYASNVLAAVEMPKKKQNKRHEGIVVWEDKDLDAIKQGIIGHRTEFMYYVLIYTGMRIGEVLGLKYSDIKDNAIHVDRQLYKNGETIPPKYNSNRIIPMHKELINAYEKHCDKYKTSEYIFTTKYNTLYDVRDVRRSANRLYKRIGVEPKGFHAFRSTFCTNLCRAKVPIDVAAKLLGHKSLEVTAAHYDLVKQDIKIKAINKLK